MLQRLQSRRSVRGNRIFIDNSSSSATEATDEGTEVTVEVMTTAISSTGIYRT
eukprot:jgi/Phyca11/504408/fgenesh2_kg.PHYCAscaffold_7_\